MRSYQKIQQPYKPEVQDIWKHYIYVEEKVDGSQFRIEIDDKGQLFCGSHHQELSMVDSMFKLATEQARKHFNNIVATEGDILTFFCEYLSKPKQNAIPYNRVPKDNLVIFDIIKKNKYLAPKDKSAFGDIIGLEVVPLLWEGKGEEVTEEMKQQWLTIPSFLGHQPGFDRIEGFIVKSYDGYYDIGTYPQYQYLDHPWMCTKIVNEAFKEKNKEENPTRGNEIQQIKDAYRNEARYMKAIQHCMEKGLSKNEMADLQYIVPRVKEDIVEEDKEIIKDALWRIYSPEITGYAVKGLPEFYKKFLMETLHKGGE